MRIVLSLSFTRNIIPHTAKGSVICSPSVFGCYALRAISQPLRARLLLHTLILFHRLGGDSGRGFRAVANLRIACGRADGSPRFARGHADRNATDQQ